MSHRNKKATPAPLEAFRFPVTGRPVAAENQQAAEHSFSNNNFPAGPSCHYAYDYAAMAFTEMGAEVLQLTGVPRRELLNKNAMQFFSQLIAPEHVYAAIKLTTTGYELLTRYATAQAVISI